MPLLEVVRRAGGDFLSPVGVVSLEQGLYGSSVVEGPQVSSALLATHLKGQRLNLGHGYPLRLISPNRPGVLNTKWLTECRWHDVRAWRLSLATAGMLLGLYGVFRLLTNVGFVELLVLAARLIRARSSTTASCRRPSWRSAGSWPPRFRPRVRRYLQGFLVVGELMTLIAIPLMLRKDTQPVSKAMLLQNYGANLTRRRRPVSE